MDVVADGSGQHDSANGLQQERGESRLLEHFKRRARPAVAAELGPRALCPLVRTQLKGLFVWGE